MCVSERERERESQSVKVPFKSFPGWRAQWGWPGGQGRICGSRGRTQKPHLHEIPKVPVVLGVFLLRLFVLTQISFFPEADR